MAIMLNVSVVLIIHSSAKMQLRRMTDRHPPSYTLHSFNAYFEFQFPPLIFSMAFRFSRLYELCDMRYPNG